MEKRLTAAEVQSMLDKHLERVTAVLGDEANRINLVIKGILEPVNTSIARVNADVAAHHTKSQHLINGVQGQTLMLRAAVYALISTHGDRLAAARAFDLTSSEAAKILQESEAFDPRALADAMGLKQEVMTYLTKSVT